MIRAILLVAAAALAMVAPARAGGKQLVTVVLQNCADCRTDGPAVSLWDLTLNAPIEAGVVSRSAGAFVLSVGSGYFVLDVRTRNCSGGGLFAVAARQNRNVYLPMRCGARRFVATIRDAAHAFLGSYSADVEQIVAWNAALPQYRARAVRSNGFYYIDNLECRYCVFEVTLAGGRTSRIAVERHGDLAFDVTRHDISAAEVQAGKSVRGSPFSKPGPMVEGPDRAVWALDSLGNRVDVVAADGRCRQYVLPDAFAGAIEIVTAGPHVWVTEPNYGTIVRISATGAMERFSVSAPGDDRLHIAAGADGRLWFTNGTSVGTLSDSEHEAYPIPGAVDSINAIAQGPGGRIWIAGNAHAGSAPFLASIEHGIWTRYDAKVDSDTMIAGEHVMWAAGSYSEPQAIDQHGAQSASILPRGFDAKIFAVDRQDRVWFTDRYGDVIASEMPRETPAIRYTDFGPPGISDMAFDRDGRLWIAEPKNNAIEVLDRAIYPFSPLIHPTYLLAASNGDVWYSDPQNALIGRIPKKGSGHCYAFKRVHLSCLVVPAAHVR